MATATAAKATKAEQVPARIVGQGTLSESGLPFVLVTSSSEPWRVHCVSYAYEGAYVGARMHCDCTGFGYRGHCRHTAFVSEWLERGLAALGLPTATVLPQSQPQSQLNRTRGFSLMK